jgi:hypothetical protein
MGQMTRLQIVQEGLLLAQRPADDYPTQVGGWLQRWLDSVAASWPWPMLQVEATGLVVSGPSLTVGGGSGGVTAKILKVLDNLWLYDAPRTGLFRLRLRPQLNRPGDRLALSGQAGQPADVRVFERPFGTWTLHFNPNPDRTYYLSMSYIELPVPMTADSDVPWYPNDETMVQAVAFKASEFSDGKDASSTVAAQQMLASLLTNDRIRYGTVSGINDTLRLDPTRFTRAQVP